MTSLVTTTHISVTGHDFIANVQSLPLPESRESGGRRIPETAFIQVVVNRIN